MRPARARLADPRRAFVRGGPSPGAPPPHAPGRDRWLLSYADFMTLLLALFVVLYASSVARETESASLFAGLRAAFVFDSSAPAVVRTPGEGERGDDPKADAIAPVPLLAQLEEDLAAVVERTPRPTDRDPGVSLHQTERGLVVSLASAEFFPAGGVEIPQERRAALAAMAPFLNANTSSLHFEGHTDASPIQGGPYPSNWELSSARAAAVARFFMDEHALDPTRVTVSGLASQRPLTANEDAEGRARNRRVEIVIHSDGELVASGDGAEAARAQLDALLETLPPIPESVDESLRAPTPGPAPPDIPLP